MFFFHVSLIFTGIFFLQNKKFGTVLAGQKKNVYYTYLQEEGQNVKNMKIIRLYKNNTLIASHNDNVYRMLLLLQIWCVVLRTHSVFWPFLRHLQQCNQANIYERNESNDLWMLYISTIMSSSTYGRSHEPSGICMRLSGRTKKTNLVDKLTRQ